MAVALRIAVTGAAGQIGYSLLPRIAAGEMFGPAQPVILQLLELGDEKRQAALRGVAMELEDSAYPLLAGVQCHHEAASALRDANWCLLVGAKPRGPEMTRADLLRANGPVFVEQGKAIDVAAAEDCRVVVVGNPCNTNAMIAAGQCKRIPPDRFTGMVRLDQNRAAAQLARRASASVGDVAGVVIFGNHSATMYPSIEAATVAGRPVADVIGDRRWLEEEFVPTVAGRGGAIIAARGLSSAASAAQALLDHVRSLVTVGDSVHSVAVRAGGAYGFPSEVWAGLPVRTVGPGTWEVVTDHPIGDGARRNLVETRAELIRERYLALGYGFSAIEES